MRYALIGGPGPQHHLSPHSTVLTMRVLASLLLLPGLYASNEKGQAFLDENKAAEGVVVLPSGLQYKVLQPATNASSPTPAAATPCSCHYEGRLLDGTVFDSSRKRGKPTTFAPNQVIKGWTEALQLMRAGERWELYVPSELAYGKRGAGGRIGPDEVLIFDLELISFSQGGGSLVDKAKAVVTTPLIGPLAPWHLMLFLILAFRLFGGGGGGARKVAASHILVKEEEKCAEIKATLAAKVAKDPEALEAEFTALAAKHSTCPSGKKGGALGEFGPGSMVAAFDKARSNPNPDPNPDPDPNPHPNPNQVCWSAPLWEVQGPIQTGFGFHLILVTKRTDPTADKAK